MDILGNTTGGDVKIFRYWVQKVLPAVYDDSLTYYELLAKVIEKLNEVIKQTNTTADSLGMTATELEELKETVAEVQAELDKVKNGDYVSLYLNSIIEWIDANLINFVGRIVKFVNFGLDKDGHFVTYIPTSWRFLQFDTGMVYGKPDYGCLILKY